MAEANNKTQATKASASAFLKSIDGDQKRKDAKVVAKLMKDATGASPKMWGPTIIGYGSKHLVYPSGREMDWFLIGFSPRKANMTLYIMDGFKSYATLLSKLGKFKTGKSCLYITKLDDIDLGVLQKLIEASVKHNSK